MTAVAVQAELTQMAVIVAMTGDAIRGRLAAAAGRFPMAVGTSQFSVRAGERKMCLLVVIELPDRPAIGRVTALALGTQSAMMHILRGVAAIAVDGGSAERLAAMALRTTDDGVQSQQREVGQIVIELDAVRPTVLAVTVFATGRQLAAVRVLRVVAGGAVGAELLGIDGRGMAGVAVELGVCPEQGDFRLRGVVVIHRMPDLVAMALLAFATETASVSIIGAVATDTGDWQLALVIASPVAVRAVDLRVSPE